MGVKKNKGDFFSKRRSIKESFYPKFFVKKFLQWPLKQGKKFINVKKLLEFNNKLIYTPKSCRRLDLLFVVLIYTSLFKFRSTNLTFIKQRLSKTKKKKVYENVPYNHLEKNSIKQFSSFVQSHQFLMFRGYFCPCARNCFAVCSAAWKSNC